MDSFVIYFVEKAQAGDGEQETNNNNLNNVRSETFKNLNCERDEAFFSATSKVQRGLEYKGKLYDVAQSPGHPNTLWIAHSDTLGKRKENQLPQKEQHCHTERQQQQKQQEQEKQQEQQVEVWRPPESQESIANVSIGQLCQTLVQYTPPSDSPRATTRLPNRTIPKIEQPDEQGFTILPEDLVRYEDAAQSKSVEAIIAEPPLRPMVGGAFQCRHCPARLESRARRRRHEKLAHRGPINVFDVVAHEHRSYQALRCVASLSLEPEKSPMIIDVTSAEKQTGSS